MRTLTATVVENVAVSRALSRLALASPVLAHAMPGQWVALPESDPRGVMACPLPLTSIDARSGRVEVLYESSGERSAWLGRLHEGVTVDALGPWGQPFSVDPLVRHVALLGTGARFMALLALAHDLVRRGVSVVVVHDAPTASALAPAAWLPPAVEMHIATEDGSAGAQGSVLDVLAPLLPWADAVYAAVPATVYAPLRDQIHRHRLRLRRGFAFVVAEAPMACWAAACGGCAVTLRNGAYGLVCKDGPAFDLMDLT